MLRFRKGHPLGPNSREASNLINWARSKWQILRFFAPTFRSFAKCILDRNLRFSYGQYKLFNGENFPFFFSSDKIPIDWIRVGGKRIENTIQYKRVETAVRAYPLRPDQDLLEGRSSDRVFQLVDSRMKGKDDFVVLLERHGPQTYEKIDGATRLAVLALTSGDFVRAKITLRGESRF